MAIMNRQIGWSNKSNLLYEVLREFDLIRKQIAVSTTTTTTTTPPPPGMLTIDTGSYTSFFNIPFTPTAFGWWMKMTNDTNFPRIFSFGQYPSAWQAVSIENNTLYFWYNGSILFTYDVTSYIGQWTWFTLVGYISGTIQLYINGSAIVSGNVPSPVVGTNLIYIGSENAPNTYYNGLLRDFVVDAGNAGAIENVPGSPIVPNGNTVLLLFQGTDLAHQLHDNGVYGLPVTDSNLVYNIDSPYGGAGNEGSTQFGAA